MSELRRTKARKPRRRVSPAPLPVDLNAAGRAQLGPDQSERAYRPPQDDASIEDPLHDWPED